MYEHPSPNVSYFLMFYAMAAVILVASVFIYRWYVVISASIMLAIAAALFHSGHAINNLLVKKSKIVEISGSYRLSQSLATAYRRIGRSYCSVAVAKVVPRPGFSYDGRAMQDLLESSSHPFEFSISLEEVDRKRIIESLQTRRKVKEIALSRVKNGAHDKANELRRQITAIDEEISNISSGAKSFGFYMLLKTRSIAATLHESDSAARSSLEALSNKFSAALGLDCRSVHGEEMLELL